MGHGDWQEELREALARLERCSSFTPFSRSFYHLMEEMLQDCGLTASADELRRAFLVLLRIETRRHLALPGGGGEDALDVLNFVRTTRQTQDHARQLLRALLKVSCVTSEERVVHALLRAECYHLLGDTRAVVVSLKRALALGGDHPLVHFALGYNLYCHAMRAYARVDAEKKQATATDPVRFARACRQAIAAFRGGLGSPELDAHIHWWIGYLSEILADKAAARHEYRAAARLAPEQFAEPVRERLARLITRVPDAESPREERRLTQLPPISDGELREARRLLARLRGFPKVFEMPLGDK